MASYLAELGNSTVSIITNDGRNFVGNLKGYDQCVNVILDDCFERVYSPSAAMEIAELGLYIVRGDNIAVVGAVDPEVLVQMKNDASRAYPMKPVVH